MRPDFNWDRKGPSVAWAIGNRGRVTGRGWKRPFDEPIEVGGRKLVTLLEAGEYITALPKKEHEAAEWRAAMEALLLVVERGGPTCSLASASCAR